MNFSTTKNQMIFYEKTGCAGNAKQKKLLTSAGIEYEVRSMLDTAWNKQSLGSFFEGLEKENIINQFAPKIKSGEIDIRKISKDEIIELMIKEPILIKRPLIEIDENKIVGFDMDKINELLNTSISSDSSICTCQSSDPCKSV